LRLFLMLQIFDKLPNKDDGYYIGLYRPTLYMCGCLHGWWMASDNNNNNNASHLYCAQKCKTNS